MIQHYQNEENKEIKNAQLNDIENQTKKTTNESVQENDKQNSQNKEEEQIQVINENTQIEKNEPKKSEEKAKEKQKQQKNVWDIIQAFNGLRGIFILMVLLYHINTSIFIIGEQGVDGFLIMSGWLNALSFSKSLQNKKFTTATKNFFLRRVFRILPVYYLLIALIFLFFGEEKKSKCKDDIYKMMFLFQNFYKYAQNCYGVTWSLALEVQLYLIVPIIILMFYFNAKRGFTIVGLIITILITLCLLQRDWQWKVNGFQYQRSISFFIGIILQKITYKIKKVSIQTANYCIMFSLLCFLISQIIFHVAYILDYSYRNIFRAFNYSVFPILVALFVFGCQYNQKGLANKFMQYSFLLFMNKISYSLYLFHLFLYYVLIQNFESKLPGLKSDGYDMLYCLCSYFPMIFFCAILFKILEKPFIKFGHKLTSR